MSTKKKISDIDKAIEEMQQRRDECFKHIGKAMYESCPELGDMSVADMRKAGRYLHKLLAKKAPSQGASPTRNGAPVASDSDSTSAPDGREPISRLSRRTTTRTSSWRSCARTWTPQGASFMPPRRHATPCNTRARGFWPACTCSPRRGATPRTPCPA